MIDSSYTRLGIDLMKYDIKSAQQGCCRLNKKGCKGCHKQQLNTFDWLQDIPAEYGRYPMVEVQFKNTRKGYYINSEGLDLYKGDLVVVESNPGYDIGTVTLTGKLVELAMKTHRVMPPKGGEYLKIYRFPKEEELEKWRMAQARENDTMIHSRQIAKSLALDMKIGDVEYQADGLKAIFYYIADGRVDFRQLIRVLAETFSIRVEMRQIGARQEAGRIGSIGPCGRELCCSQWKTNFVSVNTAAARIQDLSMNPQKLTGMCGKLKCCMNYEVDAYLEVKHQLPDTSIPLETKGHTYYHFKTDHFQKKLTYSTSSHMPQGLVTIDARRVFDIIEMNKSGQKPDTLEYDRLEDKPIGNKSDILEENSLTRFDSKRAKAKGRRNKSAKEPQAAKDRANKSNVGERRERKAMATAPTEAQTQRPRNLHPRHKGGQRSRRKGGDSIAKDE